LRLFRSRLPALTALVLCVSLLLSTTACGPDRAGLAKVAGYGQQLSALLEANWTLPDSLLREGAIDQTAHDRLAEGFTKSRALVERFNTSMRDVLAQEHPNPAALVPTVAEMIEQVRALNFLPNNKEYQRVLAGIEVGLRAIANYFAVQRAEAHARGFTDEQIARMARTRYDPRAVSVIVAYANINTPAHEPSS
jgi:hypothetical protein